jgi:integrase
MENVAAILCAPTSVSVTVKRPARPREYLTEREIEKLIKAAGENRWGHRDATAILIAYRHGLRAQKIMSALPPESGSVRRKPSCLLWAKSEHSGLR